MHVSQKIYSSYFELAEDRTTSTRYLIHLNEIAGFENIFELAKEMNDKKSILLKSSYTGGGKKGLVSVERFDLIYIDKGAIDLMEKMMEAKDKTIEEAKEKYNNLKKD